MGCYFSVLYCICLYIIKRISTRFISFNAGDFALVAVVQAWAAAAVGAFVYLFSQHFVVLFEWSWWGYHISVALALFVAPPLLNIALVYRGFYRFP